MMRAKNPGTAAPQCTPRLLHERRSALLRKASLECVLEHLADEQREGEAEQAPQDRIGCQYRCGIDDLAQKVKRVSHCPPIYECHTVGLDPHNSLLSSSLGSERPAAFRQRMVFRCRHGISAIAVSGGYLESLTPRWEQSSVLKVRPSQQTKQDQ